MCALLPRHPRALVVSAQQGRKIPTVGYLWHAGSAKEEDPYFGALLEGFASLGYVEAPETTWGSW
jgi:hypothetical protein